MPVLKILNCTTFKLLDYSKTNYMHFVTTYIKHASKKIDFRKNNFSYKADFQFAKEESEIASADIIPTASETIVIKHKNQKMHDMHWTPKDPAMVKSTKNELPVVPVKSPTKKSSSIIRNKLSPLQYKGEILYGIHPVYLALLQKKRNIFQLFLRTSNEESNANGNTIRKDEIEKMARAQGVPICNVDSKGMKYLAPGVVHQGVCLDTSSLPLPEWQETDTQSDNQDSSTHFPLWLILNELLDPMNVGAIIRSAYYFGIREVFVARDNSCKLSPTVSKASSGALEVVNIHQIENLKDFIQIKKTKDWNIISTIAYCEKKNTSLGPVVDVTELKVTKPTILILGNEGKGISAEIHKLCDSFISIPPLKSLHQGIDSLNVSVAAGVILYSLSTKMKNS